MNKNKVNNIDNGIVDYKFFCFNGTPFCVQVDTSRYVGNQQNFFDMDWQQLKVHCSYPEEEGVKIPPHFQQMKEVASKLSSDFLFVRVDLYDVGGKVYSKLSSDFLFVRVDLYDVGGKVYFGELTFYPSSGYGTFHPDSFDYELGEKFTKLQ